MKGSYESRSALETSARALCSARTAPKSTILALPFDSDTMLGRAGARHIPSCASHAGETPSPRRAGKVTPLQADASTAPACANEAVKIAAASPRRRGATATGRVALAG